MDSLYVHRQEIVSNKNDFVKQIRVDQGSIILLFDQFHIKISKNTQQLLSSLSFNVETVPYDCRQIASTEEYQYYLMSSKTMPVRIFRVSHGQPHQTIQNYGSITDKKPNSQKYLSPIQIAKKNGIFIGGGQRFLTKYDIEKRIGSRYQSMDKINVSCVEISNNSEIITGSFEGGLFFIDLNAGKIIQKIDPHMDAISNIISHPTQEFIFATSARKDNYKYIWDRRMLSSFIGYLEDPLYLNQRIGMNWAKNGNTLLSGSENGCILSRSYNYDQSRTQNNILRKNIRQKIGSENNKLNGCDIIVNNIVSLNDHELVFSTGTRTFPLEQQNYSQVYNSVGIAVI